MRGGQREGITGYERMEGDEKYEDALFRDGGCRRRDE